ncbi:hypothetical protein [Tateyamaria sp. SN3-11]|uniref:hypothetical protein n=1 Tax=Tateyamaria sp. SN3-11 TaxID=3092147 RepID=UPI0039E9A562
MGACTVPLLFVWSERFLANGRANVVYGFASQKVRTMRVVSEHKKYWDWPLFAFSRRSFFLLKSRLLLKWVESISTPRSPRARLIRTKYYKQRSSFGHWRASDMPFPATHNQLQSLKLSIAQGKKYRFNSHQFVRSSESEIAIDDTEGSWLLLTPIAFEEACQAIDTLLNRPAHAYNEVPQ